MKRKAPEILEVDTRQLQELLRRAEEQAFQEDDYETIGHVLKSYVYVTGMLRDKKTAISRLRKILFGSSTEKTDAVVAASATSTSPDDGSATDDPPVDSTQNKIPKTTHRARATDATVPTNIGAPNESRWRIPAYKLAIHVPWKSACKTDPPRRRIGTHPGL